MKFIHLTPAAVVFVQLGALAVGMASWLDDDEGSGDSGGDAEFDDDFDDDFGSFDDMDGGADVDSQDTSVNELERRIEELETEVSNVASKANTVRSENEQISESVEDVEENVRKLLEIYEMVTRGVNPFVDDVNSESMGGGSDSFGLFDEEETENDAGGDELDPDIAEADADDFFEDGTFDDEDDEGDELDDVEDAGEAEPLDEDVEGGDEAVDEFDELDELDELDDEADDPAGDVVADAGGGTSFEDLKAEYESGDADWADESDAADADAVDDGVEAEDPGSEFADRETEAAADEMDAESEFQFGEDAGADEATGGGGAAAIGLASRSDGPHLAEPPKGYLADVVALEWLDHLLSEFGPKNTVRTLNYYERIGWIGEPVRDQLFDYLEGLTDSDYLYREEFGSTELTMDDHLESLDYIDELASENIERAVVDRFDDLHRNGIQR